MSNVNDASRNIFKCALFILVKICLRMLYIICSFIYLHTDFVAQSALKYFHNEIYTGLRLH